MKNNFSKIKVVGAGGIGSYFIPAMARLMNYGMHGHAFEQPELWIIDGDSYESKNLVRQAFSQTHSGNKAEVTATSLATEFNRLFVRAVPEFLNEDSILRLIGEDDILFLCVDNHATRKLVSQRCRELNNVIVVSGGNDLTDGSVQVYIRRNGQDVTLPLDSEFHQEISSPNDEIPREVKHDEDGCQQRAPSAPQLLIANFAVASAMLNAFYGLVTKKLNYDEAYVDIISNKTRPVSRGVRNLENL